MLLYFRFVPCLVEENAVPYMEIPPINNARAGLDGGGYSLYQYNNRHQLRSDHIGWDDNLNVWQR